MQNFLCFPFSEPISTHSIAFLFSNTYKLLFALKHSGTSPTSNYWYYQSSCSLEAILSPLEDEKKYFCLLNVQIIDKSSLLPNSYVSFHIYNPLFLPYGSLSSSHIFCLLFWFLHSSLEDCTQTMRPV